MGDTTPFSEWARGLILAWVYRLGPLGPAISDSWIRNLSLVTDLPACYRADARTPTGQWAQRHAGSEIVSLAWLAAAAAPVAGD